jgi:replicative DNA helicase
MSSNYFTNLAGDKRGSEKRPRFRPIEISQRLRTSFDCEAAFLGSLLLLDSQCESEMAVARKCLAMVSQAQFFGEYEQVAFNAISKLIADNREHAAWIVCPVIANHFGVDENDVCQTIMSWMDAVPNSMHAEQYAQSVIARWQDRELINALNEFGTRVQNGGDVFAERQKLTEAIAKLADAGATTSLDDYSLDALFDKAMGERNKPDAVAISSGLPALDNIIKGGAKSGQLIVVAARPSHGKSVLGCQWALSAATHGFPTMVLSFEMRFPEVIGRTVQMASVRTDDEIDTERFRQHKIYIPDVSGWNISRIELECESATKNGGVKAFVIDHLLLVSKRDDKLDARHHYTEVTRRLKQLAMRLNVPIVLLTQMNRKIEERESKVPNFHDLAESGSIEQDGDILVMLWRDEVSKVYVTKQRDGGQTGVVNVMVHPTTGKFVELADEREVPGWD